MRQSLGSYETSSVLEDDDFTMGTMGTMGHRSSMGGQDDITYASAPTASPEDEEDEKDVKEDIATGVGLDRSGSVGSASGSGSGSRGSSLGGGRSRIRAARAAREGRDGPKRKSSWLANTARASSKSLFSQFFKDGSVASLKNSMRDSSAFQPSSTSQGGEDSESYVSGQPPSVTSTTDNSTGVLRTPAKKRLVAQTACVVVFVLCLSGVLVLSVWLASRGKNSETAAGHNGPIPSAPPDLGVVCSAAYIQLYHGYKECQSKCFVAECCMVLDNVDPDSQRKEKVKPCFEDNKEVCREYAPCVNLIAYDIYNDLISSNATEGAVGNNATNETEAIEDVLETTEPPPANETNGTDIVEASEPPTGNETNGTDILESTQPPSSNETDPFYSEPTLPGSTIAPPDTNHTNSSLPDTNHTNSSLPEDTFDWVDKNAFNAIKIKLKYYGIGWVGFAVPKPQFGDRGRTKHTSESSPDEESSDNGFQATMVGSEAVIGVTAEEFDEGGDDDEEKQLAHVLRYNMTEQRLWGVRPMDLPRQTLINATIEQDELLEETTLTFIKWLDESVQDAPWGDLSGSGENETEPIAVEERAGGAPKDHVISLDRLNTFLWAKGDSNELGFHGAGEENRGQFSLNLTRCHQKSPDPPCVSTDPEYTEEIVLAEKVMVFYYKLLAI